MWIFWIFLLAGLILLIWWIIKQSQKGDFRSREDALDILKKRYAKGEIDKQEFEQKKRDILSQD